MGIDTVFTLWPYINNSSVFINLIITLPYIFQNVWVEKLPWFSRYFTQLQILSVSY